MLAGVETHLMALTQNQFSRLRRWPFLKVQIPFPGQFHRVLYKAFIFEWNRILSKTFFLLIGNWLVYKKVIMYQSWYFYVEYIFPATAMDLIMEAYSLQIDHLIK